LREKFAPANRRFSELRRTNFQQIIGRKLSEFLDENGGQNIADGVGKACRVFSNASTGLASCKSA